MVLVTAITRAEELGNYEVATGTGMAGEHSRLEISLAGNRATRVAGAKRSKIMITIRKALFGAGLAALATFVTAAEATVFIGTRSVGTASITLSVTTDGTLGTLATPNITDWNVVLADPNPNNSFTFTPLNSRVLIVGDALSATASSLTFDFASSGADGFEFYEDPSATDFIRYYCVDTGYLCQGTNGYNKRGPASSAETVADENGGYRERFKFEARSGLGVIGTVPAVVGGVPEPASWAMMIFGFGLVGNAMRRRSLVRVSVTT